MKAIKTIRSARILLLAVLIFSYACAPVVMKLREAHDDFNSGNYDKAASILEEEFRLHPKNAEIRSLLFRARLNSYYLHLAKAREWINRENKEEAEKEYQIALGIFPGNTRLQKEMEDALRAPAPQKKENRTFVKAPIQLKLSQTRNINLNMNNSSLLSIFKALGYNYGVNIIFDKDFRDQIHSVDIKDKGFFEILQMLCMIANSLYRVTDTNTVFVYPDQPFKKQLFDQRGIKVFYLSNIKVDDVSKILQPLFSTAGQGTQIQTDPNLNALIVRADLNTLQEMEKIIPNLDIAKSEVGIDVEIIEINRSLISKLGVDFGTSPISITAAQDSPSTEGKVTPIQLNKLQNTNFYMTIPSVALNILESDGNNRIIAKPNLRGLDGEDISYMVGDEIPIPQTQISSIAAGGISTVPLTTYQYKNVGVEIKITPFIHHENEITLEIKLTMNFLSSSGYSSQFPTLGKRELEAKIRLKEGETNIIGGFIRDDVRQSMAGIPALSKIPILGHLFGSSEKTITQTDLVFSITPHIIRRSPITEKNQLPIWLDMNQTPSSGGQGGAPVSMPPSSPMPGMPNPNDQEPGRDSSRGSNSLLITPSRIRIPANTEAFFAVSLRAQSPVAALNFSGSVNGDAEIIDLKTDFFDSSVKTMKNASGNSFNVGYSFTDISKGIRSGSLLQIKMKFPTKGNYVLSLEGIQSFDFRQSPLIFSPATAAIEVY